MWRYGLSGSRSPLIRGANSFRRQCSINPLSSDKFVTCKNVNGRFISPFENKVHSFGELWDEFLWKIRSKILGKLNISDKVRRSYYMNKSLFNNESFLRSSKDKSTVTWFGHSTCYVQIDGKYILTDPIWSKRAFPLQFAGPLRHFDAPIEVEELKVDIVVLSHTHYDHLDYGTAMRIGNRALWVVPLGVKELLSGWGISNCVELNWWDKLTLETREIQSYTTYAADNASLAAASTPSTGLPVFASSFARPEPAQRGLEITFTPAMHWTARTPFDRNKCLWGSFVMKGKNSNVFFGGDTAYCSVFKTIGEEFGPFDLSLIPIGCYLPRDLMENIHCDPSEAVQIHKDLRSRQSVGIHWGTFHLADDEDVEPAFELARVRAIAGLSQNQFCTLAIGETLTMGDYPRNDFATIWPLEALSYIDQRFNRLKGRKFLETKRHARREWRRQLRRQIRQRTKRGIERLKKAFATKKTGA